MKIEKKLALLSRTDLLGSFQELTLRQLCEQCREVHLNKDDILFRKGTYEDAMYLILEGELVVYRENKQIAVLGPAQYLGEMALIESKPRSASAKALSNVLLMEVTKREFDDYFTADSKALLSMMRTLSRRIRNDLDIITGDIQKMTILAHDMRNCLTPLGLVEGFLEDILDQERGANNGVKSSERGETIQRTLQRVIQVTDDLSTLINQSLSQTKAITFNYRKTKADIVGVVRDAIEELSCHKDIQGKQFKVTAKKPVLEGYFNILDVKRVLHNLIINAANVINDEGTITIAMTKGDGVVYVSVIDEGPGIKGDIKPFLMKDAITTSEHGTGLGLLSCREIIENRHQGRLWYDSVPGKGTSFHFAIPE